MTTRIYRTWQERVLSGVFTKAQCGQFASAAVPLALGIAPHGKRTNLTEHEARSLREAIWQTEGMRLTDEHTEQGIKWLRDPRNADQFPQRVLDEFSHFTFNGDGFNVRHDYDNRWAYFIPVWRIHTHDGQTLDYCAAAWQSGQPVGPRLLAA